MERNKGEKFLCYKINPWKVNGSFETLNDISENLNRALSIIRKWILYSNYKKELSFFK